MTQPMTSYIFKHALVQDAAYGSLLRSRRQRIHADIALALKRAFRRRGIPAGHYRPSFRRGGLAE